MLSKNAPAKINLTLHVTGQRGDGYHLIDSLVVFADNIYASDSVYVSRALEDGLDVSGPYADDLQGYDNIVLKIRDFVRKIAKERDAAAPPVQISLVKRIPVASGVGGGSADAAAALKLLYKHWQLPYRQADALPEYLASRIGADIPICMAGEPLRAKGIGEIIDPIPNFPSLDIVLVNCGTQVETAQVFTGLQDKQNMPMIDVPMAGEDMVGWLRDRTRNDLQEVATTLYPEIQLQIDALNACDAMIARMSGSGATCFGIFKNTHQARIAAHYIQKQHPEWWVITTRTSTSHREAA